MQSFNTGAAGVKAASAQPLGTLTSAIDRLDLSIRFGVSTGRAQCVDIFADGVKIVTDLPFIPGLASFPTPKALNLHIPSGKAISLNAASNTATNLTGVTIFASAANVAETVTVIEPLAPVGSGANYTMTTGTLVKVPLGSNTSGWVCLNTAGATANAYRYLYPHIGSYNDITGRTNGADVILELGYADDAAGTNLVSFGVQYMSGQASTALWLTGFPGFACQMPAGKFPFARITLSTNSTKSTGTVTDGDPFNVQLHGGRS